MSNKERHATPAGIAKWAWLHKPDTQYKDEGQYKVTLVLDESDEKVQAFLDNIRQLEADALREAKNNPKTKGLTLKSTIRPHTRKNEETEEIEEVEGFVEMTFKTTASGVDKKGEAWTRKLPIFDSKGQLTDAKVGSGSRIRVSFTAAPYATKMAGVGLALYLESVKVLNLVEFKGGADQESYGFGDDDDGDFVADKSAKDFPEEGDEPMKEEEESAPAPEEEAPAAPVKKAPTAPVKKAPVAAAKKVPAKKADF
jgi:hypothetical protein